MSKPLFNDFEPVSAKAWKQKIQMDLKGADYNDTLIWKTYEGINVTPFYHADNFESLPETSSTKATQWKIAEHFRVTNSKTTYSEVLKTIEAGTEHLLLSINSDDINLKALLNGIDLNTISVDVFLDFLPKNYLNDLDTVFLNAIENSQLLFHNDIINNLAKMGSWYHNRKEDHKHWETTVKITNHLSVDLSLYQNAGANMVQQLAYTLVHTNEYLNHLSILKKENSWSMSQLEVTFITSVGSNYFFEIAKLKALRLLWVSLADEYDANTDCKIIAKPSKRNKTIYDYNVNMLRTTTECMSAVLGGANVVCNLPYDVLYHKPNDFGNRISRNQLLVLKHESYFDKVDNPTDGAYYIENLTVDLAEKALELFKNIEANGGFLSELKAGTIQRKIKENASKEQADFNAEKLILLGTNKHPNAKDKMKNNLELHPFLSIAKRKTIIEPILQKRLSEKLEINRLKNE